jgi:DNA-directed RNA polymerase specialized sigma24 family protein
MTETEFEIKYNSLIKIVDRLLNSFDLQRDADAQASARIALYRAIMTFDESLNLKLSNYAYRCIYNCLCVYVRHRKKEIPSYKLVDYEGVRHYSDGDEYFEEGSTIDYQDFIENQMHIDNFKKTLSERELFIVEELLNGTPKGSIMNTLGISREWFRRLLNRIRYKYVEYNHNQ